MDEFKEFDSEESENEFWAYWGTTEWSDTDQLLYDNSYNLFRATGTC